MVPRLLWYCGCQGVWHLGAALIKFSWRYLAFRSYAGPLVLYKDVGDCGEAVWSCGGLLAEALDRLGIFVVHLNNYGRANLFGL